MTHAFFAWCDRTAIAEIIRQSTWAFPIIMTVHLIGLAWLGGAILPVDLRLVGVGWRERSVRDLAGDLRPWLWSGIVLMLGSGALLFTSEALRCYDNPPFWLKMTFLAVALVFTATGRAHVVRTATAEPRWRERVTGVVSLGLWLGVALMGRGIGFW